MQGPLLVIVSILQLVSAMPPHKFTIEELKALKLALNYDKALRYDKPLFISGAIPALNLLVVKNIPSDEYVKMDSLNKLISPKSKKFYGFKLKKNFKDILAPIYRSDAVNIKPISKRLRVTRLDNQIRKKRQTFSNDDENTDNEEEEPVVYAEELGFGLSTAGGVLGGALGGYLDTTGQATIKLIKSLENLGLLAIGQIDTALDRQEESKRKEQERRKAQQYNNNSYERT